MKPYLLPISLCFISSTLLATTKPPEFIQFFYNVHSNGHHMTDKECQILLRSPNEYNIVDDKPVYRQTPESGYKVLNYKRLSTTFINKNTRLFYGSSTIKIKGKETVTSYSNFLLSINSQTIRGSYTIPKYCTANIIGLRQGLNSWNHKINNTINHYKND